VGEGVWLPLRVEVDTDARILIKSIRRRNLFTYSDFLPRHPRRLKATGVPGGSGPFPRASGSFRSRNSARPGPRGLAAVGRAHDAVLLHHVDQTGARA